MPEIGRQTLDYLKMRGAIDIGANKIKTTNLDIYEETGGTWANNEQILAIYNRTTGKYANVLLNILGLLSGGAIRTPTGATSYLIIDSHDGSAYVTNIKLVGGAVELYNARLTSDLNVNSKQLYNTGGISKFSAGSLGIYGAGATAASPGDAIHISSRDSLDVETQRLVVTGGVDIADIKILNAYIDLNDQTLAATAGTLAGYFIIKVGGTQYKVPAYNLS